MKHFRHYQPDPSPVEPVRLSYALPFWRTEDPTKSGGSNHSASRAGLNGALGSRVSLFPLLAATAPGRKYDLLLTHAGLEQANGA